MSTITAWSSVEHLWCPEVEWYTLDVETCGWAPEEVRMEGAEGESESPAEGCGPEDALWFQYLEEASEDGKPDVVLPELVLTDTVWQKRAKEGKKKDAAAAKAKADGEDDDDAGIVPAWRFV